MLMLFGMAAASAVLLFPLLEVDELIEGFRKHLGTGFDLREDDFAHPTKERWVRLYCFLLAHVTDDDVDDLVTHLQTMGRDNLDFPELYVESQLLTNLTKFMSLMMVQWKIGTFTKGDIVCPTKKRLVNILSGIMHFILFRALRKKEVAVFAQKMVLGQIEVSRSRFEQLSKNSGTLKKAAEDLKLQIAKKELDMHKRQERVARVAAESNKIEEAIVTSPDRFEKEIENLEAKIPHLECKQNLLQQENVQLIKMNLQTPQIIEQCHVFVKGIMADLQKEKVRQEKTFELARVRGCVHDLQEEAEAVQDIQKEKLENLNMQKQVEKMEVVHRLEGKEVELKLQELMIKDRKKRELADKWEITESRRQSIQREAAEKTKQHEDNMQLMHNEYVTLLSAGNADILQWMVGVDAALDKADQFLKQKD